MKKILIHPIKLLPLTAILLSNQLSAATFSTNFESITQSTVATFSITNNSLEASFSGGTNFTIGNGALYHSGVKSWMIDPAGTSDRGESTGVGEVILSEDAQSLELFFRNESASNTSTLQVLDSTGTLISEHTGTHTDWTKVDIERIEGESLISRISLSNVGTGMVAIDDMTFSTPSTESSDDTENTNTSSSSGSSGGALSVWFLLLVLGGGRQIRKIKSNKTR